jgi:hypothetical protein
MFCLLMYHQWEKTYCDSKYRIFSGIHRKDRGFVLVPSLDLESRASPGSVRTGQQADIHSYWSSTQCLGECHPGLDAYRASCLLFPHCWTLRASEEASGDSWELFLLQAMIVNDFENPSATSLEVLSSWLSIHMCCKWTQRWRWPMSPPVTQKMDSVQLWDWHEESSWCQPWGCWNSDKQKSSFPTLFKSSLSILPLQFFSASL